MSTSQDDKRGQKRRELECPAVVADSSGEHLVNGRTVNISDGGAVISIPVKSLPDIQKRVRVKISVPRLTANTRMQEEFISDATVIRHQPLLDDSCVGMVIRFTEPMDFGLYA